MPSIEVVPPVKVVLTPVEAQTFDVTVSAPNPVVQVVSEGPQGPGVPRGGVANDLLVKQSGTDFDTGWADEVTLDALQFDLTADEGEPVTGQLVWNAEEGTVDLGLNGDEGTFLHVGQETVYRVSNRTGSTILKGRVCRFAGTIGNSGRLTVALFDAAVHPAKTVMGIAADDIPNGSDGYVVHFGKVRKVKTDFAGWVEGDILFAAAGDPGGLTRVRPASPNAIVTVAALVTRSAQVGELFVRPTFAPVLTETQDVRLTGVQDGQVLTYDSSLGLWVNEPVPADRVFSVNGAIGTVVLDATDVGAYPDTNPDGFVDAAGAAVAAPVQSVNSLSGTVVLDAAAVGAVGTATGLWVYDYGTAIPSVRPDSAAVYWRGTAAPGTAVALPGDLWYDTTGDS